jgi:hypothetical protein
MELNRAAGGTLRAAASLLAFLPLLLSSASSPLAKERLLVFRPEGRDFAEVVRGMDREIREDFEIGERTLASGAGVKDMAEPLRQISPRLVILMDNRVIDLYKRYQASLPDSAPPVPSISLMAASLDHEINGLKLATGIAYEIPILTSAVNLRSILKRPLPQIGIVHRDFLAGFVAGNREYCRREGMALTAVALRNQEADFVKAVRRALRTLFEEGKVDALWVPNDFALLTPELLRQVWIPMLNRYRKPVIVGVEALAQPGLGFGTLAVLPDHLELGRQLSEMILEVSASGFSVPAGTVRQPLSIIKVVNLAQARKIMGLGRERLGSVDRILE